VNILNVKRKCRKGVEGAYLQVFSNVLQGESNSQDCFSLNEVRLELTKAFFIFQMYKHERTDILETHLKGALEEGLFSNLEKFVTNRTELIQTALLSLYRDYIVIYIAKLDPFRKTVSAHAPDRSRVTFDWLKKYREIFQPIANCGSIKPKQSRTYH